MPAMKLVRHIFVENEFLKFVEGDQRAYRKAFDHYFPIIFRYVYSKCKHVEDAEEITQEAFTQLYLHRQKVHTEDDLYPYLFVITKRLCISHFRKQLGKPECVDVETSEWSSVSYETEDNITFAELSKILHKIIASLPPQQQEIYRLSRLEDVSHQEIAEQMGISKNTVKNHLLLATKVVRLKLQKMYFLMLFF